jgi:hypothetical protein
MMDVAFFLRHLAKVGKKGAALREAIRLSLKLFKRMLCKVIIEGIEGIIWSIIK